MNRSSRLAVLGAALAGLLTPLLLQPAQAAARQGAATTWSRALHRPAPAKTSPSTQPMRVSVEPATSIETGLPQVVAWCRDYFGENA